jgi:hypothetical protein
MRQYTTGYQTAYANFNNGQPAKLFSSYDQQTINTHFQWMQQNGCDTAALQRFNPNGAEGPTRDAIAARVRTAAQTYGRRFYIMYDVSGWTNMQSEIKADWIGKMSALTSSPAYARQNGSLSPPTPDGPRASSPSSRSTPARTPLLVARRGIITDIT